jgi:hypothetical protein
MATSVLKLYTWSVYVLDARECSSRYRIIAQDKKEAEQIGGDLARMGMRPEPLLVEARRQVFTVTDRRETAPEPE